MSDYFDNLISRTLGLGETLVPRPLSRYEPSASIDHLEGPVEAAATATLAVGRTVEPPQELQLHRKRDDLNSPAMHQPPGAHVADVAIRAPADTPQIEERAAPPREPGSARGDVPVPAEAEPTVVSGVAEDSLASTELLAPGMPARTLLIVPATAPTPTPTPSIYRTGPREPPAGIEGDASATIKITIGRVDVRAVLPEPSPARPAADRRNTGLSLEQYLKERSGGKR